MLLAEFAEDLVMLIRRSSRSFRDSHRIRQALPFSSYIPSDALDHELVPIIHRKNQMTYRPTGLLK